MSECLECKTELEFDYNIEMWTDEDTVVMKNRGHCPQCGKLYKWKDIYRYAESQDVEERY